jgi:cytochrome P450
LSRFPGPTSWTAFRFVYIRHIVDGTLAREIQKLHRKYGEVVRVAPDELSFATPEALQDIYANIPGRPAFPKGPFWNGTIKGQPTMVLNALNRSDHARMRKNIASALTEKAIRAQEGIIERYATKLVYCLERVVFDAENGVVVDITRWLNFTAFDLIGDLGFGESFNCLESDEFHPWAIQILATFKAVACAVSLRYYPCLDWLLRLSIPKSVWGTQRHHFQLAVDKLQRRLGLEKERQRFDLIGMLKLDEQGREGLTTRELHAHAPLIIIAGSQTIVTVLSGIINFLVKNPGKLDILTKEVRNIQDESEITLAAIKNLKYLNAVINEGLRICMPA